MINIKSKKGAEIALNTIIIAIIVLVVLVIIIAFFAGGASSVIDKIKSILSGKTEGQDMALAVQNCQEYCETAKQLKTANPDNPNLVRNSAYCTKWVKLDYSPKDGSADKTNRPDGKNDFVRYYCSSTNKDLNADSTYVGQDALAVGCSIDCETGR